MTLKTRVYEVCTALAEHNNHALIHTNHVFVMLNDEFPGCSKGSVKTYIGQWKQYMLQKEDNPMYILNENEPPRLATEQEERAYEAYEAYNKAFGINLENNSLELPDLSDNIPFYIDRNTVKITTLSLGERDNLEFPPDNETLKTIFTQGWRPINETIRKLKLKAKRRKRKLSK